MSFLKKFFGFGVLILLGMSLAWHAVPNSSYSSLRSLFFMTATAEDEEDDEDQNEEEEDEEDEDEEEDENQPVTSTKSAPKTKTIKVIQEIIEYKMIAETVLVTKEDYARDTDGDRLVDAIDPDPLVAQSEYFTDIDGDSVPNALDQHHDEDDFAYYDFETDDNDNGIIDSYEQE